MNELIVNFVIDKPMEVMEALEKRDYIHSHLHQIDESFIDEMYEKMHSRLEGDEVIVGYRASGMPITKSQFVQDIKEAERQIERGEFVSLEDLEKESEEWG